MLNLTEFKTEVYKLRRQRRDTWQVQVSMLEEIATLLEAGEACRAALENLITTHGGVGGKLEYSAWIADAKAALRRTE